MTRSLRALGSLGLGLLLAGCATAPSPLDGAWRSDRALTLADLRQSQTFELHKLESFADPERFGRVTHVYRGDAEVIVREGKCSAEQRLEIVSAESPAVVVRYFDRHEGTEWTQTLFVDGDRLYAPISVQNAALRETFVRVPLEEVARDFPCTRKLLAK